jgi:hypothetical protein
MSTTNDQRTLATRMSEGRIPVSEALHYAMSLADALRKLHDAGKCHGAVAPSAIVLTSTGIDLIPSLGPQATVTPYTPPEVLQGQPADARSDVFSFGAVVFEMLTGRQAFEGESQTELKLALCNAAPPPSGSPSVDRLVNSCVAKSPGARWQRMQKIILELKLLTVAARKADKPVVSRGAADAALRTEMQQMEARFAEKLAAYEKSLKDTQASYEQRLMDTQASYETSLQDAQSSLVTVLEALKEQLTAVEERPVQAPLDLDALHEQIRRRVQEATDAVSEQLRAHVTETVSAASASSEKQSAELQQVIADASQQVDAKAGETVAAVNARMEAAEQNMEEIRKHFATLQAHVAGDLHEFEKNLKAQGVAIDSARTAMAQTDDLVERVVEALELLQSSMIDQHEAAGVN